MHSLIPHLIRESQQLPKEWRDASARSRPQRQAPEDATKVASDTQVNHQEGKHATTEGTSCWQHPHKRGEKKIRKEVKNAAKLPRKGWNKPRERSHRDQRGRRDANVNLPSSCLRPDAVTLFVQDLPLTQQQVFNLSASKSFAPFSYPVMYKDA